MEPTAPASSRSAPGPTPKGLILDLLSTLRSDAMPVRALVAAAELFDLPENGLRVALARLVASGTVERDERGMYRMGPAGAAVRSHVVSWRNADRATVAWSGEWIALQRGAARASERAARRAQGRALRWLGFRPLASGLALRPDNLAGGATEVRARLGELGADPSLLVFRLAELAAPDEARARALWDVAALRRGYLAMRERLEQSRQQLTRLSRRAALAETFRVGGEGIRLLARDPLLPGELAPVSERTALVAALREYDRHGRRYWAEFMQGFGLSRARTPLDLRVTESAGWLSAAAGGAR